MSRAEIGVQLDLRTAQVRPESAADYLELWQRFAPQLLGVALSPQQDLHLTDPELGSIGLHVMSVPKGAEVVREDAHFAIHSVLQHPAVKQGCGVCSAAKLQTHAPFVCVECRHQQGHEPGAKVARGASYRVCVDHVVLLEGALRAYCPAHAPRCECGAAASGWCFGQRCGARQSGSGPSSGRAFCAQHLQQHPKVPDVYYCARCFELQFPVCGAPGCASLGTIRCTHVDPIDMKPCNSAYCREHARRWQVYGPHHIGLGRCPEHSALGKLQDADVIYQVAAGTQIRREAQRSEQRYRNGSREPWVRLPSLQAIGHILTKARNKRYAPHDVNSQIEALVTRLDPSLPFHRKMLESLEAHAKVRQQNLERDAREREAGRPHFEALVRLVRRDGFDDVADALSYADYRPNANRMFVQLPVDLRKHFVGAGGGRRRGYEERLGVKISFEKGDES